MATSSHIAIKTDTGYEAIYCHFDGYPDYMLPLLKRYYNTEETVKELISLGDASYLQPRLKPLGDKHSFADPEPEVSVFYHRDRGEDWFHNKPKHYSLVELLHRDYYVYVFEDGHWNCYVDGIKKFLDRRVSIC